MQSGSQIAVPGISLNTRDLPTQGKVVLGRLYLWLRAYSTPRNM